MVDTAGLNFAVNSVSSPKYIHSGLLYSAIFSYVFFLCDVCLGALKQFI